jgi:hypothetical protein
MSVKFVDAAPSETNAKLEAALGLAERGHKIFPANGKRPQQGILWKDVATTDRDQIRAWWDKWPDATIGLCLAPNQMVVDIDDLPAVQASGLDFPDTAFQTTGNDHVKWPHRDHQNWPHPGPIG